MSFLHLFQYVTHRFRGTSSHHAPSKRPMPPRLSKAGQAVTAPVLNLFSIPSSPSDREPSNSSPTFSGTSRPDSSQHGRATVHGNKSPALWLSNEKQGCNYPLISSAHDFPKAEKLIHPRHGRTVPAYRYGQIRSNVMSVEKFDDMKTALVHVKMNVPFLEIRSHGFPYFRLRIQGLHGTPRGKSETPSMIILRKEE